MSISSTLPQAIADDDAELLERLLPASAPLDVAMPEGESLASWAVLKLSAQCLDLLVCRGVDLQAVFRDQQPVAMSLAGASLSKDRLGETSWREAAQAVFKGRALGAKHPNSIARRACLAVFLNEGVDLGLADHWGANVFHQAASAGNLADFAAAFPRFPHALQAPDSRARRPIHRAACAESHEGVELLIQAGVDLLVRDDDGLTPAQLARALHRPRNAELLDAIALAQLLRGESSPAQARPRKTL